jgi:hypothetical protein
MKKNILLFILLSVISTMAVAQQKVVIKLIDGTTIVKEVWEVQNITFEPSSSVTSPATAEAIDLGLSVKWANFNFGATAPEGNGYLIGWGDATGNNLSKNLAYFPTATPATNITNGEYDIAHKMWGSDWRYPTAAEMKELIDSCTWSYDATKKGYTITSNKNSNSIFLPLSGQRNGKDTLNVGTSGLYWTGTLASDNTKATALAVDASSYSTVDTLRYIGCAIRPVFGKYLYGAEISSDAATNVSKSGATINATFAGDYKNCSLFGVSYSTESGVNPDNGTVITSATVGTDGSQTYTISGLQPNTTYYYVVYLVYNGNRISSQVQSFTTEKKFPVADAVDLGLSVKWASWNMGATKESEFGNYIAWGDPTGENTSYTNSDYPNNGDIGGTQYDVAKTQWGGKWRMPTAAEIQELDNLTKEIVTKDGVSGFLITGANGNSIFIPRGGYKNAFTTNDFNTKAYYWSSNIVSLDYAKSFTFGKVTSEVSSDFKILHMLVRAVYDDSSSTNPVVTPLDTTALGKAAVSVDLGLSVKWATYNLGAKTSTDSGDFYAWGETSPKTSYSLANYKNYNTTTSSYVDIGDDIKNTEYDAVRIQWGGTWRMPTNAECQELVDKCTWVWSTTNYGYTVTGPSGKSIFLPAAGKQDGTELSSNGTQGHYWTSNVNDISTHIDDHWSYKFTFTSSQHYANGGDYRYDGLSIRPVRP